MLTSLRRKGLERRLGVVFGPNGRQSLSARFVPGKPGAITVGPDTLIAFKTLLIARHADGTVDPIRIGSNCFIGGGATILPGVTVGDGAIVGAGAVVFDDVPPRSAVGGNPARVIRRNIETGRFGRLLSADLPANKRKS